MSGFAGRQHSSESRAKISAALTGKPHPRRTGPRHVARRLIDALAERNRVKWDDAMDAALREGLRRKRNMLSIAEDIGVSERTAARRADSLGLERPRRNSARSANA